MELPKIYSYGKYQSENYGSHSLCVSLLGNEFYFSYSTLVAFTSKDGLIVCENCWSRTTGKHLNWIDNGNKKSRLKYDDFQKVFHKHYGERAGE